MRQKKYVEETTKLNEQHEMIKSNYEKEIKYIEEWTGLQCDSILFDSDICDWNQNSSTFDKHIWNKEKLVFLIETENDIRYGGFIYSKIDKYRTVDEEGNTHGVEDSQSFLFSFKDNKSMKYEMKEHKKNESTFLLYDEDDDRLFIFGECDIWVGKKGRKAYCKQNEESLYDYQGNENALTGTENGDKFDTKRIVVYQFKSKEEK